MTTARLERASTHRPSPPPPPTAAAFLRWSRRVAVVGWVELVAMVVWGFQSGALTSVSALQDTVDGFGPLAPVVYALVGAGEAVFPVLPGSATIMAAPILFGPVVGVLVAYAATSLGSMLVFALSRHVGQDLLLARFRTATVERWLGWLQHQHFTRWFAVAIALPVAPDDLLCYLAGLSRMRWRTFVVIILLLKPWALIVYTFGVLTLLSRWIPWLAG
ncbi:TVP38/TMEM64 family protein [Ornithinimicrobium tianjinense]|uniref:TVP38/TMEM64 family membrane protein n=1 Tax=Ornithinimicrobium tianjinense TaxID=1195761 RepID=A0A917F3E2_9MICO|nr:VTT domain-containing protein [Ornithinimicrobium tianjinense]GGF39250.1 TVP38/TMEM64 family protein [Ornithinimicrobium tianjinense]